MATRTPKLQRRSQYHSYWGQYSYSIGSSPPWDDGSNGLPGAPGNPLSSPDDFARLEVGDIAATTGLLGETGLWVCVSTPAFNTCVWRRLDNAGLQQTIRDAHMIVVAHQSGSFDLDSGTATTNALLNINPQVAGVSADFIDPGDGTGLASAIAAANAIVGSVSGGAGVDVRLRPCNIQLDYVLTLPHRVNLIGAGKGASILRSSNLEQRILNVSGSSTIRDLTLSSTPPDVDSLSPSGDGVLHISGTLGTADYRDVYVDNVDVLANVGTSFHATARHGIVIDAAAVVNVHIHACRVRADSPYDDGLRVPQSVAIIDRSNRSYQVSCVSCTFENFDIGFSTDAGFGFFTGNVRFANCFFDKIAQVGFLLRVNNGGQIFGLEVSNTRILMQTTTLSISQAAVQVEVESSGGEIMNASFCGVHAAFLGTPTGGSFFALVNVNPTSSGPFVRGLKFVACGNDELSPTFVDITDAIRLSGNGIVGGDVLCTWNVTGSTLNVVSGSPTWEQAHLV